MKYFYSYLKYLVVMELFLTFSAVTMGVGWMELKVTCEKSRSPWSWDKQSEITWGQPRGQIGSHDIIHPIKSLHVAESLSSLFIMMGDYKYWQSLPRDTFIHLLTSFQIYWTIYFNFWSEILVLQSMNHYAVFGFVIY